MKKFKFKYLLISLALFAALILFRYYAPKPVDWRMSFDRNHKAPYGCYVLNRMYPEIFSKNIVYNNETLYGNALLADTTEPKNLVIITNTFRPDDAEIKTLIDFVNAGNTVFVAAHYMAPSFLDTLELSIKYSAVDTAHLKLDKDVLHFYSPQLENDSGYVFQKRLMDNYFQPRDSCDAFLLGYDRKGNVNFVRFDRGKGALLLNSKPLAFTNLHVLYSNPGYATTVLSFLPDQPTIIDRYYKPFRIEDNSPTQFILSQKPLQTAFYIVVAMLLIYMLWGARRKQKAIPVVLPLENTSLEFIKTVGRLYYKSENHANIAQKKTIYFKEFLREKYYINDISETDENIAVISAKTGVAVPLVARLVRKMSFFPGRNRVSKEELMSYNKDVEAFKKACL